MYSLFFSSFTVILEASEISTETEEESLSEEHLTQFMKQWVAYDINDHRSITVSNLRKLLQDLDTPLGFGKRVASDKEITELVVSCFFFFLDRCVLFLIFPFL